MAKKKVIQKFIAESERQLAAWYFTLSNTAMLFMVQNNNLEIGYIRANECMQMECGASLREELLDWWNSIQEGNEYCFEEWEKVKGPYIKAIA